MFVALEPSEDARAQLAAWRDALVTGRDDLRPVAPAALHVTLAFLGWQDESDAGAIAGAVGGAMDGMSPARLGPAAVKPVPPRGTRLFALDLEDEGGRCGAMQAAVSAALESARFYRPEKRPFWPHMTLARVKRGRRAEALEAAGLPEAFDAGRVTLYRSTLRPQGAVYDALAQVELSG
jgi:RNA 2',3'-cyclic 3'-phosphodiesterase